MVKNIVLCSDGTGNSCTKGRGTNVFKLYEAVDIHGHKSDSSLVPQVAFYDDGVGTENFAVHRMLGAAFGFGFAKNIRDLYTELVHVYRPGDKLYLFGFSRGAYTIRALAGMIRYCGVVDRYKLVEEIQVKRHVQHCWKAFEKVAFPRFAREQARRLATPKPDPDAAGRRTRLGCYMEAVDIEFIGVWDTVGAVGMPVDILNPIVNLICPRKFDELTPGFVKLSPEQAQVKRACHALSIDDERGTFHPELWNEAGAAPKQVDQVWFAGVHSNVGGGYPKHGMSLVTLDWMMSHAENCGLRFFEPLRKGILDQRNVNDKLYDSRAGYAVYYRWKPRNIAKICNAHGINEPKIHNSVFERIATGAEGYAPGSIPANLKIVYTPHTLPARSNIEEATTHTNVFDCAVTSATGRAHESVLTNVEVVHTSPRQPGRMLGEEVQQAVRANLEKLGAPSLQDLPDMRFWKWMGYVSYYSFLALTIATLYCGLRESVPQTGGWSQVTAVIGELWQLFTSTSEMWAFAKRIGWTWVWLAAGFASCLGLARLVDAKMESRYSMFWHDLKKQLDPWGTQRI